MPSHGSTNSGAGAATSGGRGGILCGPCVRKGSFALLLALRQAGLDTLAEERIPARLTVRALVNHTSILTGEHASDILGHSRQKNVVRLRHAIVIVALWQAEAEGYYLSLPMIGREMGGRDHSTVINSRDRALALILRDPDFAWLVERLWSAAECEPHPVMVRVPEPQAEPEPAFVAHRPSVPPKVRVVPGEYVPRHALPPVMAVLDDGLDHLADDEPDERFAAASSSFLAALRREHPEACAA